MVFLRSSDQFLGFPFNVGSYALLTCMVAKVCNLKPRELIISMGDVHIYKNHMDQVKEQISRRPKPLPNIKLDRSIKTIDDFTPDKVTLENYDPHPIIKGELAVSGGYYPSTK